MSSRRARPRSSPKSDGAAESPQLSSAAAAAAAEVASPGSTREAEDIATAIKITEAELGAPNEMRALRKEERDALQLLNKRLELYILNQREKEAGESGWKREYEMLSAKYKRDMEKLHYLHESNTEVYHQSKLDLQKTVNELRSDNTQRESDSTNALRDLEAERTFTKDLQKQLEGTNRELLEAKSGLARVSDEARTVKFQQATDSSALAAVRKDLALAEKSADEARTQLAKVDAQLRGVRDELEIQRASHDKHVRLLEKQLADVGARADSNIEQVRQEYEDNMNKIFEDRHRAGERDKDEYFAALRQEYDEKMSGYRLSLERLGHDLESERQNTKRALDDVSAVVAENDRLRDEVDDLTRQKTQLAGVADELRRGESKLVAEKNEVIRNIKDAFKQKDAEFDALMDVKIAMALELRTYRSLLEAEEQRLSIVGMALGESHVSPRQAMQQQVSARRSSGGGASVLSPLAAAVASGATSLGRAGRRTSVANGDGAVAEAAAADQAAASSSSAGSSVGYKLLSSLSFFRGSGAKTSAPAEAAVAPVISVSESSSSTSSEVASAPVPSEEPTGRKSSGRAAAAGVGAAAAGRKRRRDDSAAREEEAEVKLPDRPAAVVEEEGEAAGRRSSRRVSAAGGRQAASGAGAPSMADTDAASSETATQTSSVSISADALAAASSSGKTSLLVSGRDLNGQYVEVRNGSGERVVLAKWSLRIDGSEYVYVFPSRMVLGPGQTFALRTCATEEDAARNNSRDRAARVHWMPEAAWGAGPDRCCIVNPDGEVKAFVRVDPSGQPDHADLGGASGGADGKQSCVIM